MGFPRRDRRTDAARLAVSTMAWHSAGSDVTKIVPQAGNEAAGPARQARVQQALCVSGGTHDRSVSTTSHTRARLHIGYGPSPGGETPRSVVRDRRCAAQPTPTNRRLQIGTASAPARARPLTAFRGAAQRNAGTAPKGKPTLPSKDRPGRRHELWS